jgi:hypothetical protein
MSGAQLALRRSHFPEAVEIGARVARKLAYVRWCEGAPRANSAPCTEASTISGRRLLGRWAALRGPALREFHVRSKLPPTAPKILYRGV